MFAMRTPYGDTPPGVKTRIRDVRKGLGLTLEAVADKIGVQPQTLQRWETGARGITVDQLHDVAAALGVSPRELIPGDDGLSVEERDLLEWFRAAPAHERRAVTGLATSLSEGRQQEFRHKEKAG